MDERGRIPITFLLAMLIQYEVLTGENMESLLVRNYAEVQVDACQHKKEPPSGLRRKLLYSIDLYFARSHSSGNLPRHDLQVAVVSGQLRLNYNEGEGAVNEFPSTANLILSALLRSQIEPFSST
ncbi:hypothetical protein LSTR_LSTR016721 [Laodelphax striatellus]|uniref:Uncharacterized protein n=1 Tax=Laodelphax striatellus TaxID=195883 RepID=A0A482XIR8_LAOST|nr:hypothetical protein LSTR_LSTR000809 [Laodelphax striatellus]RZF45228.1 hypothetical protein LSTR_LSTR016721 [Laodelphax striatellus]